MDLQSTAHPEKGKVDDLPAMFRGAVRSITRRTRTHAGPAGSLANDSIRIDCSHGSRWQLIEIQKTDKIHRKAETQNPKICSPPLSRRGDGATQPSGQSSGSCSQKTHGGFDGKVKNDRYCDDNAVAVSRESQCSKYLGPQH